MKVAKAPSVAFLANCKDGFVLQTHLRKAERFQLEIIGANADLRRQLSSWLSSYANGIFPLPTLPLFTKDLSLFQNEILAWLSSIPFGKKVFYSDWRPNFARATGTACHRNPFPLLIPCHRVVARKGLGGFAPGIEIKQALLEFEDTAYKNQGAG